MTKKPDAPSAEEERRARLAQALRNNLHRRKDQARGRADEARPERPAETADQN